MNEMGFAIDCDTWRIRLGIRTYGFEWKPGIEESGSSYPAEFLDVPYGDRYWKWSWLWFVVFLARAGR